MKMYIFGPAEGHVAGVQIPFFTWRPLGIELQRAFPPMGPFATLPSRCPGHRVRGTVPHYHQCTPERLCARDTARDRTGVREKGSNSALECFAGSGWVGYPIETPWGLHSFFSGITRPSRGRRAQSLRGSHMSAERPAGPCSVDQSV